MKTDIHPAYGPASVRCSCGNTFTHSSTKSDLHVELCNECHPFYTGKQKLVDAGGRVERFERRYGQRKTKRFTPAEQSALAPALTERVAGVAPNRLLSRRRPVA